MAKKFSRTLHVSKVKIINSETKEIIKEEEVYGKMTRKAVMKDYLKNTASNDIVNVFISIESSEEQREMTIEDFIKHSKVVEPKENQNNESEVK